MGLVVLRIELESAGKFCIAMLPVPNFHVCLRQLIVGLGKASINLGSITELNDGFTVLALTVVALPAFQIFLLSDIRIARASGEHRGHTAEQDKNTNQRRMLHYKISQRRQTRHISANFVDRLKYCTKSLLESYSRHLVPELSGRRSRREISARNIIVN